MTYVWKSPVDSMIDTVHLTKIVTYLKQAQAEIEECMIQLSDANAQLLIPVMNEYDAKFRLMLYYMNNPDLVPDNGEDQLIELVDQDYERWFQEGMEEQPCRFIRQNSLFSCIGPFGAILTYLWNPTTTICEKLQETSDEVIHYYSDLQKEAQEYLPLLSGSTFEDIYPELLRIDLKCQMLFQSITCVYFRSLSYSELRNEIETNCLPYFLDIINNDEVDKGRSLRCITAANDITLTAIHVL